MYYYQITSMLHLKLVLREFNSSIRIIVVVCDPISRLLTRYFERQSLMHAKTSPHPNISTSNITDAQKNASSVSFDVESFRNWLYTPKLNTDTLDYVGNYIYHFKRLFMIFQRKQVFVVDKTQFYSDPENGLSMLHTFLGVQKIPSTQKMKHRRFGRGGFCFTITHGTERCVKDPEKLALHTLKKQTPNFVRSLVSFYNKSNHKLYDYLGRNFHWL